MSFSEKIAGLVDSDAQVRERRPLAELKQTQRVCQKVEEMSFLRKMTSNSTVWPQAHVAKA